ncbi:hypothetical protein [Tissierella sp.]|uniref:hypothetical protein n=1 Tax=Tissierella sp. TaxID=41274 RepID=UPI0028553958|nr:hypothetical protein [Tissierella sp.]MDR7856112.1 hypothetical protein [Tissierella sp.]
MKKNEIFIKNTLDVEVDALKARNRYKVKAMYDIEQEGGYYKIEHRLIEDLTLTWDEIEEMGGIAEVNREFRECYGLEK